MRDHRSHSPVARDPGRPGMGGRPRPENDRPHAHGAPHGAHRPMDPPPPRRTPRQARYEAARRRDREGCASPGCSCCLTGVIAGIMAGFNRLFRRG